VNPSSRNGYLLVRREEIELSPGPAERSSGLSRALLVGGQTGATHTGLALAELADGHVDDQTFAAVVDRWGRQGAMDLIGVVGYYCLVSFILNVDRVPVPGGDPLQ
jgi:hypothetical protein